MPIDVVKIATHAYSDAESFVGGQLIAGKYRVERLIGTGGMGFIVSAWHIELERSVALKLVRSDLAADELAMQRLMLEARAAAKLTNEHVCRVIDVERLDNGAPYLVLELLEGCDLAALLEQRGQVSVEEAVDWMLQACEALAEAHAHGIVHRDLKPENLFLIRPGGARASIKVLDFGISKQLGARAGALTSPGTALGSPQYMSPEQMLATEVDQRGDIWAIGAILYELIGGRAAFGGESIPEICTKVLSVVPDPLRSHAPHAPLGLCALIHRCLSKERSQRFSSVTHLARELVAYGSDSARRSLLSIVAYLPFEAQPPDLSGEAQAHRQSGLEHAWRPTVIPAIATGSSRRLRVWGALIFVMLAAAFARWLDPVSPAPTTPEAAAPQGGTSAETEGIPDLRSLLPVAPSVEDPGPGGLMSAERDARLKATPARATLTRKPRPVAPPSPLHPTPQTAPPQSRANAWDVESFGDRE